MFLQFLRQSTGGLFDPLFLAFTYFGEPTVALVIISIIYWCLDKKLGEYLILSRASAYLVNSIVKVTACVYRPWILDSRIHPVKEAIAGSTGYSFPSGHVTTATGLFGGLALRGKFSRALKIVLIIALVLVAFSRVYLGVHTVPDVVFGFILTLIVLVVFSKLFDKLEEHPNLDIIISSLGIVISILVVIFTLTKSYPMDYDAAGKLIVDPVIMTIDTFKSAGLGVGLFLSWPIERRFICFSADGSIKSKLARAVLGLIALLFIFIGINMLFGDTPARAFWQCFAIMILVMLIYPAIIKFFQDRNN